MNLEVVANKLAACPEGAVLSRALLSKGEEQEYLFGLARRTRHFFFPDDLVEVRSVIEVSNICRRECRYCGMNAFSKREHLTIGHDELMVIVRSLYDRGRRVILLQSGENCSQDYIDFICRCVAEIKRNYIGISLILCVGNLAYRQFRQLRDAGADRYILKFETSNPALYEQMKPGDTVKARIEGVEALLEIGFEVGTGNIVGLPGQTIEDLVNDLHLMAKWKLSMVSSSLFIPGKNTEFEHMPIGDMDITLNFMSLLRLLYPHALIPTTSSLEQGREAGQLLGLMAGANTVTIHDGTPALLEKEYPIYTEGRFIPDERKIRSIVERANLKLP